MGSVAYYLTNFEFYANDVQYGSSLQRKRMIAAVAMYCALAAGIFARQIVVFAPLNINTARVGVLPLVASFLVGLALLPPAMRLISKKGRDKPSFSHVIVAYSLGFVIDLSLGFSIDKIIPAMQTML